MKGRDLINYIQENKLEDVDFPIYTNDGWSDYISAKEAAKKYHVKESSIINLVESHKITGTILNGKYYIPKSTMLASAIK